MPKSALKKKEKERNHRDFFLLSLVNSHLLTLIHGDFLSAGPKLSHVAGAVYLRHFSSHESTALPFSNAGERGNHSLPI